MARPPFDSEAEHSAALNLAIARHQIAHESAFAPRPPWAELTNDEQESATIAALHYLRAGRRIGMIRQYKTIDEYLDTYASEITAALDAEGIIADRHEVLSAHTDDGPAAYWTFEASSLSVDESWPEGITIIWDWERGWLDNKGVPLPLPNLAAVSYVAEAIRAHIGAYAHPAGSKDAPEWYDARPLEHLLTRLAEEYA